MSAFVRLENVSRHYDTPSGRVTAVDDVSLEVEEGEILGVIGYSGAGKSTLVRLINALELPSSGRVIVGDDELTALPERELRRVRGQIGMIFQQFNLFHSRTVAGNVAYPLRVAGVGAAERDRRVAELLDFVGLLDKAHAHPEQLSGGQKQRVGIARALATQPRLLLADEATSALDPETTADVLALLKRVNQEFGLTIVVITHEMEAIRAIADRVAVMDSGRVVEHGDVYDVFANPSTAAASRFVRTVLHDRPSASTLERLRAAHPGRLVTIPVQDRPAFTTLVARTFEQHRVGDTIVFGGISELQNRAIGALTYELTGAESDIDAALAALAADGVVTITEDAA
ncbi:methionine ABC transporter ATP-binding protein [Schumannella luteola]|uniref:D-methionine transport system ATP-binding protein n=1 Tax=Schumannella luteola TaxID=472059 RepID=A0A852YDE9_9MICO|nr:methionine ABC transporter ATP-binding protein [Schumannella luteola]NYG99314.1 D-methionine transport system ATP-binding protein [Schumannella luteola]TPX06047.1 methionine ABC transporter ATP-binding protein [Schumannella luteola]